MELFSNSFSVGESSGSCFEACVIDYHTFILKRRHNKESNMMFGIYLLPTMFLREM